MIFLDTSAIYALADVGDRNHPLAVSLFRSALEAREVFLVHNYVLLEAAVLLQHRLGLESALQFLGDARAFQTHWVDAQDHQRAVSLLQERDRRPLSLVDCMSFTVMSLHGIDTALAFDTDFEREGFVLYSV